MDNKRVLVGFSGGVDSTVAALLLRERGHDVLCAMMSVRGESGKGCGSVGDSEAAGALAEKLGLPFRIFDCSERYRETVLENFRAEYLAGRTPNPCVVCNPGVKFSALPALARESGWEFDLFATGHYARIGKREGRTILLRGADSGKDQSYFLYRLGEEILGRVLFPLGGMTKREVRALAERWGVEVHDKPDSQDFYQGDYAELLGCGESGGEIVNLDGEVLGRHGGYWRYTPGQRKGLRVAFREPLYVVRLEPERNRVVVGTRDRELSAGCVVGDVVLGGAGVEAGKTYSGRLRSAQPLREMTVAGFFGGDMEIRFADPVQGVAPGQSLVLYDGDEVIGGGFIRTAVRDRT